MADIEPQQANHPPGGLFPPSTARPRHNIHNLGIPPAARGGQLERRWEDVLTASTVERDVVQGVLQDPQHINVTNYGIADYPELPGVSEYHAVPYTCPNVVLGQGVPERENLVFNEHQGGDRAGYAPQGVVPYPTQANFPGPSAHPAPVLAQQAAENLRRLASRCVHHPDSRVDVVRMEPGTAGRYKVVIVLEMTDFL